jgi:Nucleotidyl transferase AbiEii toxin, Type IV TA system
MLDFPVPHLRAYARETVIAEKFQAMVMLGHANTRMKDFYDIWVLSQTFEFKDGKLPRGRNPRAHQIFARSIVGGHGRSRPLAPLAHPTAQ